MFSQQHNQCYGGKHLQLNTDIVCKSALGACHRVEYHIRWELEHTKMIVKYPASHIRDYSPVLWFLCRFHEYDETHPLQGFSVIF